MFGLDYAERARDYVVFVVRGCGEAMYCGSGGCVHGECGWVTERESVRYDVYVMGADTMRIGCSKRSWIH